MTAADVHSRASVSAPKAEALDPLGLTRDVSSGQSDPASAPPRQIVWRNVVLMTALHIGSIYGMVLIPQAKIATLIWAFWLYVMSGLGITAGAHRLWSHRSYKASWPLRLLLVVMNSLAFQNDVIEWARDHRVHHKYSESNADPHNAKRGFFFSHIGWLLVRKHPDVKRKGAQLDISDLLADPILRLQRKFYLPSVIVFCFVIPTLVPVFLFGESFVTSYFICGLLRYCVTLNATWLVNSAAHTWGWRPYDKSINPRENPGVCIFAVGEGFHNYHHTFPQDYATSEFGWILNLSTVFIDCCAYLGLAYDCKTISKNVIENRKRRTGINGVAKGKLGQNGVTTGKLEGQNGVTTGKLEGQNGVTTGKLSQNGVTTGTLDQNGAC